MSVTFETERTEIRHLLAAAKPSVLSEFRDHNIPLRGLKKSSISPSLTDEANADAFASTAAAPQTQIFGLIFAVLVAALL